MALTGKYYPYDASVNPSGYKAASLDEARAKEYWNKPENTNKDNNPFPPSKSSSATPSPTPTAHATGSRENNAIAKDARNGQYTTTESSVPVDDLGNPVAGSVYVYDLKLKRTVPSTIAIEYAKAFSNTKILSDIRAMLIKYGQLDPKEKNKATVLKAYQNILIGASTERVDTSSYVKNLQESGFGWNVGKAKAPDTNRQVYNYKPEEINALINDVYTTTLGRSATPEELAARFATLNKQIKTGTTTTSKVVKNATTNKMETLVTSTPAFSKEAAKTSIEEELKKANPDDFDRKSRIDFASFLTKNVAGA